MRLPAPFQLMGVARQCRPSEQSRGQHLRASKAESSSPWQEAWKEEEGPYRDGRDSKGWGNGSYKNMINHNPPTTWHHGIFSPLLSKALARVCLIFLSLESCAEISVPFYT